MEPLQTRTPACKDVYSIIDTTTGVTVETGLVEEPMEYESYIDTGTKEPILVTVKTEKDDFDSYSCSGRGTVHNSVDWQGCTSNGSANNTNETLVPFDQQQEFLPKIVDVFCKDEFDSEEQNVTSAVTMGCDRTLPDSVLNGNNAEFDIGMLPLHIAKQKLDNGDQGLYSSEREETESKGCSMYIQNEENNDRHNIEKNFDAAIEMVIDELGSHLDIPDKNSTNSDEEDAIANVSSNTIKIEPLEEFLPDNDNTNKSDDDDNSENSIQSYESLQSNVVSTDSSGVISLSLGVITSRDKHDLYSINCPKPRCKWTSYCKDDLDIHLKYFHEGHKYHCEFNDCNESFSTKESSQGHFKQMHLEEFKKVHVGRRFRATCIMDRADGLLLSSHERYPCSDCNKTFKCESHLKEHMRYHWNSSKEHHSVQNTVSFGKSVYSPTCVLCGNTRQKYKAICDKCDKDVIKSMTPWCRRRLKIWIRKCVLCDNNVKGNTSLCEECKDKGISVLEVTEKQGRIIKIPLNQKREASMQGDIPPNQKEELSIQPDVPLKQKEEASMQRDIPPNQKGVLSIQADMPLKQKEEASMQKDEPSNQKRVLLDVPLSQREMTLKDLSLDGKKRPLKRKKVTPKQKETTSKWKKKVLGTVGRMTCIECYQPITPDHYRCLTTCYICGYRTECFRAYSDHKINWHESKKLDVIHPIQPIFSKSSVKCVCGFTAIDEFLIADHLTSCGYLKERLSPNIIFMPVQPQMPGNAVQGHLRIVKRSGIYRDIRYISSGEKYQPPKHLGFEYSLDKNKLVKKLIITTNLIQKKPEDAEFIFSKDEIRERKEHDHTYRKYSREDLGCTSKGVRKAVSDNNGKFVIGNEHDHNYCNHWRPGRGCISTDESKKVSHNTGNSKIVIGSDDKYSCDNDLRVVRGCVSYDHNYSVLSADEDCELNTLKVNQEKVMALTVLEFDSVFENVIQMIDDKHNTHSVTCNENRTVALMNYNTQGCYQDQVVSMKDDIVENDCLDESILKDYSLIKRSLEPIDVEQSDNNGTDIVKNKDVCLGLGHNLFFNEEMNLSNSMKEGNIRDQEMTTDRVQIVPVSDLLSKSEGINSKAAEIEVDLFNVWICHNYCVPLWKHLRVFNESPNSRAFKRLTENISSPTCYYATEQSLHLFSPKEIGHPWRSEFNV